MDILKDPEYKIELSSSQMSSRVIKLQTAFEKILKFIFTVFIPF